ncbi:unnamed protein product [Meganyctiphanes norvegica]|uniref:Uncharacterized protein n=1 Tax=Meganyctiphanes norvegica TaxID=48144 RepID=A0AAV2S5Z1_MEGNR
MKEMLIVLLITSVIAIEGTQEIKEELAGAIDPKDIAMLLSLPRRADSCPSTGRCNAINGTCKPLHIALYERCTRYACCTGTGNDPDDCQCCVPDGCHEPGDVCSQNGGQCRLYCLNSIEDQLDAFPCRGICNCCKPKDNVTTSLPPAKEKKCKTKERCVKKGGICMKKENAKAKS